MRQRCSSRRAKLRSIGCSRGWKADQSPSGKSDMNGPMPIRVLHIHSTFSLGGKEARAVRLMNAFGDGASHVVLSGVSGALGARDAIDPGIRAEFPSDHPPLTG